MSLTLASNSSNFSRRFYLRSMLVVSISIEFEVGSQKKPFHRSAFDWSLAKFGRFQDHFMELP